MPSLEMGSRHYHRSAVLLKSWPVLGFDGLLGYYRATPMAGDFNRDGRTDIAVLCPLLFPSGLRWTADREQHHRRQ